MSRTSVQEARLNDHMEAAKSPWDDCEHEWIVARGDWDSNREQVECSKCECLGERYDDGSVHWPAT